MIFFYGDVSYICAHIVLTFVQSTELYGILDYK